MTLLAISPKAKSFFCKKLSIKSLCIKDKS